MREEKSYRCAPPVVHCFLNGRFECECGEERHDEQLTEMILAMATTASHPDRGDPGMGRDDTGTQASHKSIRGA
jgi:hypothetical protein